MGRLLPDKPEETKGLKEEEEATTKEDIIDLVRDPRDLYSSVFTFLLIWLIAITTGRLLDVSLWLFFPAALALLCVVYSLTMRIIRARRVHVKAIEVALLGFMIPLLAIGSILSYVHFPKATQILSIVLVSMMPTHLALLMRTRREINHRLLLVLSSCLLVASLVSTGVTYELGLHMMVPTIALSIYVMIVMFGAIFMLREEILIVSLKWNSLALLVLCVASSIICRFLAIHLLPGLIAATTASVLIFVYFDFLEYQMRTPLSLWTYESVAINFGRAAIKLLAFVLIASWGVMGMMQEKIYSINEIRNATIGENSTNVDKSEQNLHAGIIFLVAEMTIFLHCYRLLVKYSLRRKEPNLQEAQPIDKCIVISGIFAVAAMMVACTFLIEALPIIPVPLVFISIGSMLLIITDLLDYIRELLVKFNWLLWHLFMVTAVGLLIASLVLILLKEDDGTFVMMPSWYRMLLIVLLTLATHFMIAATEDARQKRQVRRARLHDPFHSRWASF